eukprot:3941950-Rhodomonas_salina.4
MLSCFSLRKFLSAFFKGRARGGQVRLQEARDEAAALREEKAKLKVTSPVACPLCTASLVTSLRSEQSRPCAMCSHAALQQAPSAVLEAETDALRSQVRQTETDRDRQRQTETETETDRHTHTHRHMQMHTHTCTHIGGARG